MAADLRRPPRLFTAARPCRRHASRQEREIRRTPLDARERDPSHPSRRERERSVARLGDGVGRLGGQQRDVTMGRRRRRRDQAEKAAV
ncbi:unnamed protein product [Arabis nemorensis]|uniref:Uncharacterized protein n=1 Tax=Arabis nemorensis TaxID=586526 RepID=A0A565CJJ8_9BRAS|nr:unnamed protein product [Arabis nemorensis]